MLFVVLDTVRAANTSLCGYRRPTTPFLEKLRDETGAAATCHAYTPGTWTIPSHASYFTGVTVPEHGSDSMGHVFKDTLPVLSERMRERGYQSIMVTANPTLSQESGLQRGFERVIRARHLNDLRGREMVARVRTAVGQLPADKPLFLFLNILDAHDPYPSIPASLGWLPERPQLPFDVHDEAQDRPYHRFIRGEMKPDNAAAFLEAVTDGYDYGIYMADKVLDDILQALRREGWLKHGFRLIVTSDHGEFLGEHRLLRHGCYTWEPVVRVPFLYYDSTAAQQPTLPEPFAAINAYWLALDGKLPDPLPEPRSFSKRREKDVKGCADMAALWLPGGHAQGSVRPAFDKLVWKTDAFFRFDLQQDPEERHPTPLPADHPARSVIEGMATQHAAHLAQKRGEPVDEARLQQLLELGYVE